MLERKLGLVALVLLTCACSNPETDKVRYLESGNKFAAEKRYAEAIIEYRNAVQIDPKFGEARLGLAEAYEKAGEMQAAAPEYIRAADALPDHREAQIKATTILLLARQFEDARARATAFLTRHPDDVEMLLLRANSFAALKDPDSAIAEIEEALKVRPDDSLAYVNLGGVQLARGDAEEAEAAFRRAVTLAPSSVNPRLALANFLWLTGRRDDAEGAVKEALALDPRHSLANRMLAVVYLATRRVNEAEEPLKKVAELTDSPAAKWSLADYYVSARRFQEATKLLETLATSPAFFADAESRLAAIEYTQGRRDDAHERIDAVLKRAPNNAGVLQLKARWLIAENKLDDALATAKAAASADPQSASAHYVLAVVQDRRREVADAIKSYSEVVRLNPRAAEAQVQLSRLSLSTGDAEAAVRFAEGARQAVPDSGLARVALARGLLARGDIARATPEVAALLKTYPNDAAVLAVDGSLQFARGDLVGARRALDRALAVSPGLWEAISALSLLDIREKKPAAAIARLEAEIPKQPNNPSLLVLTAAAYSAAGDHAKTEQLLRRAVTADPRYTQGYGMLAQFYLSQRRLDDARLEFEGIVKRDPSNVGARTMVGILLSMQNRPVDAQKWYEDTVAVTDRAAVAANNLAFMYAEAGTNLDQALQLASSAKQQMPDSADVDDTLGWVYYKRDMAPMAIRSLEASVEKNPRSELTLYHLGLAYAKAGEKGKARDMLQRALKLNPQFEGADVARKTLASL